jgi:hypothetical protein
MQVLTCFGVPLDTSSQVLGELRRSNDVLDDSHMLKQRLERDGYLFIQNFFGADQIHEVRRKVLESLSSKGILDNNFAIDEARLKHNAYLDRIQNKIGNNLPAIRNLIHNGQLQEFIASLLGGPSRAFDHIWLRTISPSLCTAPHCDHVYMSRGTRKLYTTWIPIGDVPRRHGSLMVLEQSNHAQKLKKYHSLDIDEGRNSRKLRFKHGILFRGMHYSKHAKKTQKELGLRWLTTDFVAGDIVIFSTSLLHATLDNAFERIRLSVDARFQLAAEPMDPRFVGHNPTLHQPMPQPLPFIVRKLFNRF